MPLGASAGAVASVRSVMRHNGGSPTAGSAYGRYQVCLNSLLCCLKQICRAVQWRQSHCKECPQQQIAGLAQQLVVLHLKTHLTRLGHGSLQQVRRCEAVTSGDAL